jgi:hypothetical protein
VQNKPKKGMRVISRACCDNAVDLHARHVWGVGGAERVAELCSAPRYTRQHTYVLAVHANNQSSNTIINHCGAGWGGFEGAGNVEGGVHNRGCPVGEGGGGEHNSFSSVDTNVCNVAAHCV